ncbi:MAG: hypothetical protein H7Z72_02700 [Bacteroidetes bacterium]|nr:hypothetical protein [Fibrella sp.]
MFLLAFCPTRLLVYETTYPLFFRNDIMAGCWFVLVQAALGQSTLNAFLTTVDANNVYLKTGRRYLDSCRLEKTSYRQGLRMDEINRSRPAITARQNQRRTEQGYEGLRQKIYQQARLTCIDLIYQRKRQRELAFRLVQIRQFVHQMLVMSLPEPRNSCEPMLSNLLRGVSGKLFQKEILINRLQGELSMLNGEQATSFPDTTYPSIPSTKVLLNRSRRFIRLNPQYEQWQNRFVVLRQLLDVDSAPAWKRESYPIMMGKFKAGEITLEDFISQLVNRYQLIDAQMRTERDLHIDTTQLLTYTEKTVR